MSKRSKELAAAYLNAKVNKDVFEIVLAAPNLKPSYKKALKVVMRDMAVLKELRSGKLIVERMVFQRLSLRR